MGDGKGELQLVTATKEVIMMGGGKRFFAVINFKSMDEPNKGLGYQIYQDGKQHHVYKAIMKDMHELYSRISFSLLTEKEARQVLHQHLILKLGYKMKLISPTQ